MLPGQPQSSAIMTGRPGQGPAAAARIASARGHAAGRIPAFVNAASATCAVLSYRALAAQAYVNTANQVIADR